jgi:hypothetical protein
MHASIFAYISRYIDRSIYICIIYIYFYAGKAKIRPLSYSREPQSQFRKIFRFLLSNDPLINIVEEEFKRCYPKGSKDGTFKIDDWKPDDISFERIKQKIKKLFPHINEPIITKEELKKIIKGPSILNSEEYQRVQINKNIFCTYSYQERSRTICSKSMIKYKSHDNVVIVML